MKRGTPMHSRTNRRLGLVILVLICAVALSAAVLHNSKSGYSVFDKEFYLTDAQIGFIRPGLNMQVTDWAIAGDGTVSVEFTVADRAGLPLDMDGIETPGLIRLNFMIATIPQGESTYVAYTTRNVRSSITGQSAVQPTADSGGRFTRLAPGTYRYTFGQKLPADYDVNATHTIGWYGERVMTQWDLGSPMVDGTLSFVPAGGEVNDIRELSTNEACGQCHDFLRVHGRRHSLELCVLCHYPGVIDPDTGSSVDMPVMTHKIHRGRDLESGYTVIGFGNSVHDYSDVGYPQDIRYCETCHVPEARQASFWHEKPSIAACGSCHDAIDFEAGVGHPAATDDRCGVCHRSEGQEFDRSVKGAHTIPSLSQQLAGVNVNILEVTSGGPGTAPTVRFTVTNDAGEDIAPLDMERLRFRLGGPATDFNWQILEEARAAAVPVAANFPAAETQAAQYTYTFQGKLPDDAKGTYAMAPEARRTVILNPGTDNQITQRDTAENPVTYFAVTGDTVVPRRMVVSDDKCETCHRDLSFHGQNRHNGNEYCQFCHNPVSFEELEGGEAGQSISMQVMIHRIHMGHELTRDYSVGGNSYNEVRYPSARSNCLMCHEGNTYTRATGALATLTPADFFSPQRQMTAACLGCHDSVGAAAHAYTNTAAFGESCRACHGEGREYAISRAHAQ